MESTLARAAICVLALVCLAAPSFLRAQPYGLTSRAPIGPYLNNRLPTSAPSATTGWATVVAFPNLTFRDPTFLIPEPNSNRLHVGTLWGIVYSFVNDPVASTRTVFLDVSNRTQVSDSSGLLGMAFHPEYRQPGSPNRGYVYVAYQYSPTPAYGYQPSYNRLSRFTVPDGATAVDPNSELVLIDQYDPEPWHNGGALFFGEDGFLYLSCGDGGGANDSYGFAQQITTGLFSGVLRIDVDRDPARSHPIRRRPGTLNPSMPSFTGNYYIPNDNPFVDPGGAILEEFYAIGLRSPHRMTYDPIGQRIWVGDVGETTVEEIDVIEKGGNYQWSYREANIAGPKPKPAPLVGIDQPPIYSYPVGDGNNCIIGGYVYRGSEHAAALDGKYLFGDNGSGRIWALTYDAGAPTAVHLCNMPAGSALSGLSSFGVDHAGEIYLCQMGPNGRIYKLARTGVGAGPTAPPLLSQTGVFSNLATLTPAPGLIPYDVNSPLWSDGADKLRWIAVPNDGAPYGANETIGFSRNGAWTFPAGTVFVKHFELPVDESNPSIVKRLETRLIVRDNSGGVYGLTYKWRADHSDADLLPGSLNEAISIRTASGGTRTQTWSYPSQQACLSCHSGNANHVLGVSTRQLNGSFHYPSTGVTDNQLRTFNRIALLSTTLNETEISAMDKLVPVDDPLAALEHRARSYLDANCSHCHRPGGARAFFDARFTTPLSQQQIVNGPVANPLGTDGAHVITPESIAQSIAHRRMNTNDGIRMPPLARNVIDVAAVETIEDWILSLRSTAMPPPWTSRDVGFVNYAGAVSYNGTAFTLNASGADISGTADAFHFMFQPWTGDGEIVARVTAVQNTDTWAKAGVMFRESLDAGARNAFVATTPSGTVLFQQRATTNGSSASVSGFASLPRWLRLTRTGSTFRGYHSSDGANWTQISSATLNLPTTIYVGLAVTSHQNNTLCTATFESVAVSGSGPPPAPPAAPTNLVATAASSSRIDLAWTDNSGNEEGFKIERSTDGTTFTQIATVAANVTAYASTGLTAATAYTYRVRATRAAGDSAFSNPATATTQPGSPPPPPPPPGEWTHADLGATGVAGSASASGGTFTVRGSGADIWDNVDGFSFFYRALDGDGTIVARVSSLTATHGWAKAGVMIRAALTANSAYTAALVTAANGVAVQNRAAAGATTTSTAGPWGATAPYWVRLTRTGNNIVGDVSANGTNWTTVATHTVSFGVSAYVGLAVTSHDNSVATTALFSDVALDGTSAPPTPTAPAAPTALIATTASAARIDLAWTDQANNETGFKIERSSGSSTFAQIATVAANVTTYASTGLAADTAYTFRIRATNATGDSAFSNASTATTLDDSTPPPPPPDPSWSGVDIGSTALAGSHDARGSPIALRASGTDIWETADGFRFLHRPLEGDGSIQARVVSLTNTHAWAKAGVMIRESLAPGARHTSVLLTPSNGIIAEHRATTSGSTTSASGAWGIAAPYWVRLVRTGNTIVASASPDGIAWTTLATHPTSLPATVRIGLSLTSHNNSALNTALFDQVVVTGSNAPPAIPAAPSALIANAVSASRIDLTWTDNSPNEEGFAVERSTDGTAFAAIATTSANATTFSSTGLSASTLYTYRVRATHASGNSAYSNLASATTTAAPPTIPAAPTNLTATAGSSTRIDLAWNDQAGNEDGYRIERSFDGLAFDEIASVGANATVYSDSGLVGGLTYTYRVRATLGTAASTYSNPATATTNSSGGGLGAPSNLSATAVSASQIDLAWRDQSSSEQGYKIERTTDGVTFAQIALIAANLTTYSDTGLSPATTYAYRVRAAYASTDSAYTNAASARTSGEQPPPPPPPPPETTWSHADIGAVGVAGSDSASGNTITVRGSGNDIWETADSFRFLYRTLSGDCTVEAQVTSLDATHGWAKAGVMIRDDLTAGSRNTFIALTPSNGLIVQNRASANRVTTSSPGPWGITVPHWIRLARAGNTIVASASPDGIVWTTVATHTVSMGTTVHVGFAVTSHNNTALNTAVFTDPFIE